MYNQKIEKNMIILQTNQLNISLMVISISNKLKMILTHLEKWADNKFGLKNYKKSNEWSKRN